MSAPETKLKEQEKRHRGPLTGIRAVVMFALVLLVLLTIFIAFRGNEPGDGEARPQPVAPDTTEPAAE